jgi:hypothetical protein
MVGVILKLDVFSTFSPNTTDDKERDEILYHKIRIFSWITEEHLDIPVTQHNESFLTFAESGKMWSMNNRRKSQIAHHPHSFDRAFENKQLQSSKGQADLHIELLQSYLR